MKVLLPAAVLVACLGWALPGAAQQPEPERGEAQANVQNSEPKAFIAGEVVRLALMDLRATAQPTPDDYQAALALLSIARDLDLDNTDIIRRQIEAAFNAGDQGAVMEFTRALIRLDPKDTVALLRFISSSVTREHQTAEDRLAAYDRYVASSVLDPSVRSRLALDAALLARERGDEKGFTQRLIQACQLDSTHKEAAALAVNVYADRFPDDAVGRLDLQVNLLKADPTDPNVHLSIARTLAAAGAYKPAKQFHTTGMNILAIVGPLSDEMLVESRVLSWYADGPGAVVQGLSLALAFERDAAAREIKRLQMARKPTDNVRKPEEIELSPQLLALSILASDAAQDKPNVQAQMKELTQRVERQIADLKNPKARGSLTEEQASTNASQTLFQLYIMRLWVDVDSDKVSKDTEGIAGIRKAAPDSAQVLDAMMELRAGRPKEAIERCRTLPSVRLGRVTSGLAYEMVGDKDGAIRAYSDLVRDEPLQMAGVWAHARLQALGVTEDRKNAEALERLVVDPRVPNWIHSMVLNPGGFVRLEATIPATEVDAISLPPIRLTLTNQTPIPLALGADRPLSSRFAMLPKLDRESLDAYNRPEVVDLDRRLRLMPQESISTDVAPAPGQTGWTLQSQATQTVRVRWEFVQGFIIDPATGYRAGPLGVTAETPLITLRPTADATLSPEQLADRITSSPIRSLARFAVLARAMALQPLFAGAEPEQVKKSKKDKPADATPAVSVKAVAQSLATRYPTLSPTMRAMIALVLPHARLVPDMSVLDDAIKADQDPVVRCIALCTRVTDPADEFLKNAKAADDARVRQIGAAVEVRLGTASKLYARLSPDDFKPAPKPGGGGAGK